MSAGMTEDWVTNQHTIYDARRRFSRERLFPLVAPLFWKLTIRGLDHIPAEGPVILMINHMAALDPVWIVNVTRPRYVVPMSKIENLEHPLLGPVIRALWGGYPIRRGQVDREALRTASELMKAGEMTLIAPEGTRHDALRQPKDGLAYIAARTNAAVVPVAIYNSESWKGDLLRPWRRTPVQISYGRAFHLRVEGRRVPREDLRRMTDEMMYQLAVLLPEHNRGEYADLSRMTTDTLIFGPEGD